MSQKLEYCCQCGNPTGRAGRGDDSLYTEHSGPFCVDCYPDRQEENAAPAVELPVVALPVSEWRKAELRSAAIRLGLLKGDQKQADRILEVALCNLRIYVDDAQAAWGKK